MNADEYVLKIRGNLTKLSDLVDMGLTPDEANEFLAPFEHPKREYALDFDTEQ